MPRSKGRANIRRANAERTFRDGMARPCKQSKVTDPDTARNQVNTAARTYPIRIDLNGRERVVRNHVGCDIPAKRAYSYFDAAGNRIVR